MTYYLNLLSARYTFSKSHAKVSSTAPIAKILATKYTTHIAKPKHNTQVFAWTPKEFKITKYTELDPKLSRISATLVKMDKFLEQYVIYNDMSVSQLISPHDPDTICETMKSLKIVINECIPFAHERGVRQLIEAKYMEFNRCAAYIIRKNIQKNKIGLLTLFLIFPELRRIKLSKGCIWLIIYYCI